ncbi:MAG TPA: serine hydrolase domain-containing protein [Steroidobacteraceae bacterium]|jgi:CubicO group peptidase (beta-lactamase class C family)
MKVSRATLFMLGAVVCCAAWLVFYSHGTLARAADSVMRAEVERGRFSGVVLVRRDGKTLFERAYGIADHGWAVPNTVDTKFEIGSISKPFTAVLVLQLAVEERLALTDSICKYLSDCPPEWAGITLRHLLSHTSGVFNITATKDIENVARAPVSRDELIRRMRAQPLAFAPGTRFSYSNSNYFLLGSVVEKVTGQSLETVLHQRILDPLGMRDTGVLHSSSVLQRRAEGYSRDSSGHLISSPVWDESWKFGAGGLYSTAADLARFSAALDGGTLLPRQVVKQMSEPVQEGYGLGWELSAPVAKSGQRRRVVGHAGHVPGFGSVLRRLPDQSLTVVVFINDDSGNPVRVADEMTALALGEEYEPAFDRRSIPIPPDLLARLSGQYELGGQVFVVTATDGRLFVRAESGSPAPGVEMLADSADTFFLRDSNIDMVLLDDGRGKIVGFQLRGPGQERLARKVR